MNIFSSLRIPAATGVRSALSASLKGKSASVRLMQVRNGGHSADSKIVIRPSTYNRDRFKDDLYYFLTIGIVPLGLFVTYENVRYGPAELKEIPDDYVPEHWEYYRDPVRRFMARNWFTSNHEKQYERTAYFTYIADQERRTNLKMKQVKNMMKASPTQREWYLVPDTLEERKKYCALVQDQRDKGLPHHKWV